MKPNWKLVENKKDGKETRIFPELEEAIERVLKNRGIQSEEAKNQFLFPDYDRDLPDPFLISAMETAVARILEARDQKQKVCVYGDYDADGVTGTAILKSFFDDVGISNFCYLPDKVKEGYGLNRIGLDYAKAQGAELIVTTDCGVSNREEVEYAKSLGLEVIITDHHHVPPEVPAALAVVNPKLSPKYPSDDLAGVGVAFKLIQAIASRIENYDSQKLKWLLDLVAIGTVADCVPLGGENRTLVKFGLLVLSKTRRVGLRQLFQVGAININENSLPSSWNISFQIAPRINAAGRMDHANTALELINSRPDDEAQARVLALEIEEKNRHRQKVTEEIVKEIEAKISQKSNLPRVIFEYSPHWELGVIGLAAGRIADKFSRPTLLLKQEENRFRGSGRSIESFNLIEALEKNKNLFEKYGGHAQAAGFEIQKQKLDDFRAAMLAEAEKLEEKELSKIISIDAELTLAQAKNEKLLSELNLLEPFGEGNSKPMFLSKNLLIRQMRFVGNGEKHLKLQLAESENDQNFLEAIQFNFSEEFRSLKVGDRIDLVYHLEENRWNGNVTPQAKVVEVSF